MTGLPKDASGSHPLVQVLNTIKRCIFERTPQNSKDLMVKEVPGGFTYELRRIIADGAQGGQALVIVEEQAEYLVCKSITAATDGRPTALGTSEILVAKQWPFRVSGWHGKIAYPGIKFEVPDGNYYFESQAGTHQVRTVMNQTGSAPSIVNTTIREEFIWPPYSSYTLTSTSFSGSVIYASDMGERITVNRNGVNVEITLTDQTERSWFPKTTQSGGLMEYIITNDPQPGPNNYFMGRRVLGRNIDGSGVSVNTGLFPEQVWFPWVFIKPASGTRVDGSSADPITYTYTDFGTRQGIRGAGFTTTRQKAQWFEEITPRYKAGDIVQVASINGTLIETGAGRSWQIKVDTNWYLTQLANTQIVGRFTEPAVPPP